MSNYKLELPAPLGTVIGSDSVVQPDTEKVTDIMQWPLNTRLVAGDSRCYRYIVDKKRYRWIGEELWYKIHGGNDEQ